MGSIDLVLFLFATKEEVIMLKTVEKDCNTHKYKDYCDLQPKGRRSQNRHSG